MKKTILIDFDGTIANSGETIIKMYNKEFKKNNNVKYKNKRLEWDFAPYIDEQDLKWALFKFTEQKFYDELELIPKYKEVLEVLNEKYELIICTKKHPLAVPMNDEWIKNKLPFIKKVIYLRQDGFDKSFIKGDIIIDDKIECLYGDRDLKILFGEYKYNRCYDVPDNGVKAKNWSDIYNIIIGN